MIDWADENNSAWSRAQRSFQSPNGSHFSPLFTGRKTSRSVVKIKSGRTGNSKSVRPDSSRSTERPVLIEKRTPPLCKSRINCMQRPSRAGSLTRETRVLSKSMLRSRMFIVAGPAFGGQLLQHKCRELILRADGRTCATQLIVSIGCLGVERADLTIDSIARRSKSKTERKRKNFDEIGLRAGDGATREKSADCHPDRRPEKAARRRRFHLQSADRGERIVSQGSNSHCAKHRKIRRNGIAREAAGIRNSTLAGRLRNKERKTAREFCKIAETRSLSALANDKGHIIK